jgi:hypothetical protein
VLAQPTRNIVDKPTARIRNFIRETCYERRSDEGVFSPKISIGSNKCKVEE